MRIDDYTAHVVVDDQELTEYGIKFETPTRATCWIPSMEGKTFSIKWQCHAKNRLKDNVGWVSMDGVPCGGIPMNSGSLGDGDTAEMDHVNTDSDTRSHDFMFSRIELSDDDRLRDKEVQPGFGEISLEIEPGTLAKPRRCRFKEIVVPDTHDKFHETSNKAAHHQIKFGPGKAIPREDRPAICPFIVTLDDEPSLFFIFKYRPIAILQAHGLVEVAPTPKLLADTPGKLESPCPQPNSSPRRSQSNSMQKAELQQKIENLRNELRRLEGLEARLSEEPKCQRIKTENPGPDGQSHPAIAQVIDLTEN